MRRTPILRHLSKRSTSLMAETDYRVAVDREGERVLISILGVEILLDRADASALGSMIHGAAQALPRR